MNRLATAVLLGIASACSASSDGEPRPTTSAAPDADADAEANANANADANANANANADADADADANANADAKTNATFRTYVILGDSISDRGGQGPFFYDLLVDNDDARHPASRGRDLRTLLGPGLRVVKAARGGAKSGDLVSQARGLPTELPGPVLITITIGGNDLQDALPKLLAGQDDARDRRDLQANLDQALAELERPARFGAGVDVEIHLANVYDPSDGTGRFRFASGIPCTNTLGLWPTSRPTRPILDAWSAAIAETAARHPHVRPVDLRGRFEGHGVPAKTTWFTSDCIHPNAAGHDAIRTLFLETIAP
jgi:lysophospholipase L1-like esterase